MQKIQNFIDLFRDEMMGCILSAPTDEATIEYLKTCLEETYELVLDTVHAET